MISSNHHPDPWIWVIDLLAALGRARLAEKRETAGGSLATDPAVTPKSIDEEASGLLDFTTDPGEGKDTISH